MFYSATDKLIYQPPIGPALDPLVVHRKLVKESGGRINEWIAGLDDTDPIRVVEAEESLAHLSRTVFGLQAFDQPDGRTDAQALGLLEHYLRYAEGKG